jgi:ribokinase
MSIPGGKGGNTAVASARVLGRAEVGVIGMLGADEIAAKQFSILENEGIDVSCVGRKNDQFSGQAYVIVDRKGENMILTHRAANDGITQEFIKSENVSSAIDSANSLVIIDPPLDAAAGLAEQAQRAGKTVVLSPATLVNHGFPELDLLLRMSDFVILNEHESLTLAPADGPVASCEKLSDKLGGKCVITTLGAKGCVLCHQKQKIVVPTPDPSLFGQEVVSTVGAGDTFTGTFASFKVRGLGDTEAAFLANVAASLKVTNDQTRGSPTLVEIRNRAESDVMRDAYNKFRNS